MRLRARPALAVLLAALTAGACTPAGGVLRPAGGASAAPRPDRPASARPSAAASQGATAPRPPAASFAPIPSVLVRGRVQLDAAYMVAAGAGNLTGSGITARLIGNDGGTLIGNDGSTLIGNDGSTLIGNDGSTLIGNDGGTLIGNDGSTYRLAAAPGFGLLQASAAPAPALAFGAVRPAARMRVRVYELASGRPVLAARDPAARRGAFVFTDAEGNFEAPVRADATANLLVYADVGGVADPRLQYTDLLGAGAAGAAGAIDEHRSLTAYFIRLAVRERLRGYLATDPENLNGPVKGDGEDLAQNQEALNKLVAQLYELGKEVRLDLKPKPEQDRVLQALQDLLLSNVDLETQVHTKYQPAPYPFDLEQRAFDAMDEAIAKLITAAEAKLNAPGGAAYFTNAAAVARGFEPYYDDVAKPADLGRVFIDRYVAPAASEGFDRSKHLFADLGVDRAEADRFRAGADAFVLAMLVPLALDLPPRAAPPDAPGMLKRFEAILRGEDPLLADRTIPQP